MTCGNTDARSTPAAAGTSPSRASQRGQRTGKRNMGDARAADGRTARALLLADLAQVRPVAELGTRERRRVERDGAARRREVELGTRGRGLRLRLRLVALAHQLTAAAIAGDLEGETVLRIHRALSAAEARDEARCARLAARLREVELRAWRRRRDLQRDLRLGLGLGFSFTVVVIAVGVLEQVAAALALLFETRVPPCGPRPMARSISGPGASASTSASASASSSWSSSSWSSSPSVESRWRRRLPFTVRILEYRFAVPPCSPRLTVRSTSGPCAAAISGSASASTSASPRVLASIKSWSLSWSSSSLSLSSSWSSSWSSSLSLSLSLSSSRSWRRRWSWPTVW